MSKWIAPRATTAERMTITPDAGELIYDETLEKIFYGDGSTLGGVAGVGEDGAQGVAGQNGLDGAQGVAGQDGADGQDAPDSFETVSKNLKSWDYTLNYTSGDLTSIVYTDGVDTITKTLNYTSGDLTSIVLSGDTPSGIDLAKTLTYTSGDLTGISYS